MAESVFIAIGGFGSPVPVASGGTGLASYTTGDLITASAATTLASITDPAVGQVLASGGVGVIPAYTASPTLTSITLGTSGILSGGANLLEQRNGVNGQTFRTYGYVSGARSAYAAVQTVTTAVTGSGATSTTGNVIPAGATVVGVATTTTTTITGATGYTVGDGSDADRYGDVTGTAAGTNTDSADYTADPRWWTNTARAIVLTAKTSNFTGGVVQVVVFYESTTAA